MKKKIQKLTDHVLRKQNAYAEKNEIRNPHDFKYIANGNVLLGEPPEMNNSAVTFCGENNIFYCEQGVALTDCNIAFNANNSLVYLGKSKNPYRVIVSINNNSVCHIGRNNYFNATTRIILSEHKHFFVGNDCLFSLGIWIRNADPHLIYDVESGKRQNQTKSIFIGDHVWIGQSAIVLKGTRIDSGSVIGAMSVCTGLVDHNCVYAGNPSRKVKESIFWDGSCVHAWNESDTEKSQTYNGFIKSKDANVDDYNFRYCETETIDWDLLDKKMDGDNPWQKLEFLAYLNDQPKKNRFVHDLQRN